MNASNQKRGESGGEESLSLAVMLKPICISGKLSPGLSILTWSTNRVPKFAGRQMRGSQVLCSLCASSLAREGAAPRGSASKSINARGSLEAAWLSWASVTHCCATRLNYLGWVDSICHTVDEDLVMVSKHIAYLGYWVNPYCTHRVLWLKLTGTRQMWQGQKHYMCWRQTRHCTCAK